MSSYRLVRYNIDGSLDKNFAKDGKKTIDDIYLTSIAIRSDGKIVVAGGSNGNSDFNFTIERYNIDGSLDGSFSGGGKVNIDFCSPESGLPVLWQFNVMEK